MDLWLLLKLIRWRDAESNLHNDFSGAVFSMKMPVCFIYLTHVNDQKILLVICVPNKLSNITLHELRNLENLLFCSF